MPPTRVVRVAMRWSTRPGALRRIRPSAAPDSRVPAEIVFDQGLGDLFVIRVAGNIVAPSRRARGVRRAALRDPLVVVLGHSHCGAVVATLEDLEQPGNRRSRDLHSIVDRTRPSVQAVVDANPARSVKELVAPAVRANIRASTNHLRHGSQDLLETLNGRVRGLRVVGAEYSLATGIVETFDGADYGTPG